MTSPRVDPTENKNIFYRDYFEKVIIILMISIAIGLLVACFVLYQVFHRPLPRFNAVAPDEQRMGLLSYNEPNLLPNTILTWASKAAVAAYTFDFVNYDKEMLVAKPYFTEAGWEAYQAAVANVITRITKGQLFVNGVVAGPPVIANQGDLPGSGYSWRVQIPFLVTYQSAEESKTSNFLVVLRIVKVPTEINPDGIGIEKFEML
ncbi:MAG: DotI/IcmL/TraM family protein [Gammaproteobacteria bacterium]|nr:DotI/IcmL/TraM family protein [Gammaproteobacteria bacterium]